MSTAIRGLDVGDLVTDHTGTLPTTRRSDAYVVCLGILTMMLIATLDVLEKFDRPTGALRYTILLVPLVPAVWIRMRRPSLIFRRPTVGDAITISLFLFGFVGSIYGLLFRGTVQSSIGVFAPMTIALTYMLTREDLDDTEVHRVFRGLSTISLIYVFLNFAMNTGILPRLFPLAAHTLKYRNANAAFVALAFACAIVERRWRRLALLAVLFVVIFAGYPSATQVLIALVVLVTLYLTSRRASSARALVVAVTMVAFAGVAILNLNTGIAITGQYFEKTHKANADSGRLSLWADGIDQFRQSPIIGTVFSANSVSQRSRDLKLLPFHNDFVLFLAEGGLVGSILLLLWMGYTELTILRRYRGFVQAGDTARANLLRVLLIMLNSFFVAMAFNPVLEGITRGAAIFGIYAIAMLVGEPPVYPERPEVIPRLSVRAVPSS